MKEMNYKKNKQEQVFEILDKQGYILDDQTASIFGEEKLWRVSEHIRIWKKLKADKEFFVNKKIIEAKKGHRSHLVRIDGQSEGEFYKVGKEFWKSLPLIP